MMSQDVKLGTHKIGTSTFAINKCAFLLGFYLEMPLRSDPLLDNELCGKGCGHKNGSSGVAFTVTNFEGFTRQQF